MKWDKEGGRVTGMKDKIAAIFFTDIAQMVSAGYSRITLTQVTFFGKVLSFFRIS
jgi:hypothetical protein